MRFWSFGFRNLVSSFSFAVSRECRCVLDRFGLLDGFVSGVVSGALAAHPPRQLQNRPFGHLQRSWRSWTNVGMLLGFILECSWTPGVSGLESTPARLVFLCLALLLVEEFGW